MWYVLNYIAPSYHTSNSATAIVEEFNRRNSDESQNLQLFAPTLVAMVERNGKRIPVEKPLTYHYVFLQGNEKDVKKLCSEPNGFSFVLNRGNDKRYLIVNDNDMEVFRTIAATLGNKLPCFDPKEIPLEEGDEVEVVAGEYPGIRGTYLPKRGGRSGNIYISVAHNFATVLYDIKAEFVKVIHFSPTTKRPYDQLEAFLPRLYNAMKKHKEGEKLTTQEIGHLFTFCRRMEEVEINNPKFNARLQAALMTGNHILGNTIARYKAAQQLIALLPEVTNPVTLLEIYLMQYIVTPTPELLEKIMDKANLLGEGSSNSQYRKLLLSTIKEITLQK